MRRASRAILVLAIVGGAFAAFSGSAQAGGDVTIPRYVDRIPVCKILPKACFSVFRYIDIIKFFPPVDDCATIVAQYGEVAPTAANRDNVEKAIVCLVNEERAKAGKTPVTTDTSLRDGARAHAQWLADTNHFCHAPGIRENLHWGSNGDGEDSDTYMESSARDTVLSWMASPGHHDMMLDIGWPTAQYIGVGVAIGTPDPQFNDGAVQVMRMSPNGSNVTSSNNCPS